MIDPSLVMVLGTLDIHKAIYFGNSSFPFGLASHDSKELNFWPKHMGQVNGAPFWEQHFKMRKELFGFFALEHLGIAMFNKHCNKTKWEVLHQMHSFERYSNSHST